MKTGILLLNLLFLCHVGNAQKIFFEQDFSNDTIAPMTSVDNDGFTPVDNLEHIGSSWKVIEGKAYAVSDFIQANKADNWLITPAIPISTRKTFLRWYSSANFQTVPEAYKIVVSTTTKELDQFTEEIFTIKKGGLRENHSVKLDAFIGDTIYIAFVHQTFDGSTLSLDDIIVQELQGTDNHKSTQLVARLYPFYKINNAPMSLEILLFNGSSEDLFNTQLVYLNKKEEVIAEIENIGNYKILTIPIISRDQTEAEELVFYLRSSEGNMLGFTRASVQILKDSPKKKILVEELSATWCGWCPASIVFFDKLKKQYEQDYVRIAVHEQDTMALKKEHIIDYYPKKIIDIPTLSFDRSFHHIHPRDGEENFLDLQTALASPFEIKVETSYNEIDRMVDIKTYTTSMIEIDNSRNRYRVNMVLTEDQVQGETSAFNQSNYFSDTEDLYNSEGTVNWKDLPNPIPARDMVYNNVLRAMLTSDRGLRNSLPATIEKGETYTYSLSYQVPAEFDPHSCNIIFNIQDVYSNASINVISTPVISTTTATHEIGTDLLEIYPNPVQDALIVKHTSGSPLYYKLISLQGSIHKSGLLNTQQTILDTSTLPKGVYFLEVWNADNKERVIEKIEKF